MPSHAQSLIWMCSCYSNRELKIGFLLIPYPTLYYELTEIGLPFCVGVSSPDFTQGAVSYCVIICWTRVDKTVHIFIVEQGNSFKLEI